MLTFFGLAPENKKQILESVFDLSYYSKGGISIEQSYNMPASYRRFYSSILSERIKKENEEIQKSSKVRR